MPNSEPVTPKTPEYEAFKRLAKGLVAVPKKEIGRKGKAIKKPRRKSS